MSGPGRTGAGPGGPNLSAVLYAPGDLRVEDRPVPRPGRGEVLVAVAATGICGSDVHYYETGRIGGHALEGPMVLGHESAGTVVAAGPGADASRVGQAVALEPGTACGRCEQCRSGRYNLCPEVRFFATPPVDGSLTGYLAIREDLAHPAPAGLTLEQAAMAEPVSVAVAAARRARVAAGDRVLVTGAGPVGLFAAQVARACGAARVCVSDLNSFRLDTASSLGLTALQAGQTAAWGEFDVVLECTGANAALAEGLASAAPAARVVLVGMGADALAVDAAAVQEREITIAGLFRYANTYPAALGMIASGAVRTEPVITHRFRVEDTEAALTLGRREERSLKAVVAGSAAGAP